MTRSIRRLLELPQRFLLALRVGRQLGEEAVALGRGEEVKEFGKSKQNERILKETTDLKKEPERKKMRSTCLLRILEIVFALLPWKVAPPIAYGIFLYEFYLQFKMLKGKKVNGILSSLVADISLRNGFF